jgi:undecaprenyl-diphosphatase
MEYWQIILLGIIQGISEFLPISSSGHLILAPIVFDFPDQGLALDAILHVATLLAIIIFFKKDLINLSKGLFLKNASKDHKRVAWGIILASFPAGLAGLFLGDFIENNLRNPTFVAYSLLFWSFIFLAADRFGKRAIAPKKDIESLSIKQILIVGFAQMLALLPGTSRSGITIAAGLLGNISKITAARFSFLLGAPIILAAGLLKMWHLISEPTISIPYLPVQLALGFIVSFAVGYLSIKLLLGILEKAGLLPFIIYRIILSLAILIHQNF